jgi:hypothetical protein
MASQDWLSGDENSAAAADYAKGPHLTPLNILEALEWAEQRQRALAKVRERRQSPCTIGRWKIFHAPIQLCATD